MEPNVEGRSIEFIRKVNKHISVPEYRLPTDNPQSTETIEAAETTEPETSQAASLSEVAQGAVALVAGHYWNDRNNQGFVDSAYETHVHLEGRPIGELVIDERLPHIVDRRKYGAGKRDHSIQVVAKLAAGLIEKAWAAPTQEENIAESLTEQLMGGMQDIESVVQYLHEQKGLPKSYAEGLLVLTDSVDVSGFDERQVERLRAMTRWALQQKIARVGTMGVFPMVTALAGNKRDGVGSRSMDEIIADKARNLGDATKAESYVRNNVASELAQLFRF
jgi:hypothetical protein